MCDAEETCELAMYKERRGLCKLYEADGPVDAADLDCCEEDDGWVTYGRVTVEVPQPKKKGRKGRKGKGKKAQQLLASGVDVENPPCYLWTQTLVNMIKQAEDTSGDRTNFLPTVGTRVPAETLKLLPAVIDGAPGVQEFEDWGYLERCE